MGVGFQTKQQKKILVVCVLTIRKVKTMYLKKKYRTLTTRRLFLSGESKAILDHAGGCWGNWTGEERGLLCVSTRDGDTGAVGSAPPSTGSHLHGPSHGGTPSRDPIASCYHPLAATSDGPPIYISFQLPTNRVAGQEWHLYFTNTKMNSGLRALNVKEELMRMVLNASAQLAGGVALVRRGGQQKNT
jgi:hypothetical protein